MKDRICKSCGHIGKPVPQTLDSFLVDALAWGTFATGAFVSGMMSLFIIPSLWTLYHLATFFTVRCPECGDLEMVRLNSRKGRKARQGNGVTVWKPITPVDIKKAA
jgi:hypothetical protein